MRIAAAILTLCTLPAAATVVGTNPPSQPLTAERIATLPRAQQAAWKQYLETSQRQMQADKDNLAAEQKAAGAAVAPAAAHSGNARSIPLDRKLDWYATPEALHIAAVVLSYQTPAGGWSKNLDMAHTPRQPGQSYASGPDATATLSTPGDFGRVSDPHWGYIGTIDNDATITQIYYLAKVLTALGSTTPAARPYQIGFLHGLVYLLAAQYPNGGWPQVYPLAGGYHDNITYNDDAMTQVLELLQSVATGVGDFDFVPGPIRKRAQAAVDRGIQCILATQIVVNGRRTVWCQQHDPLTLAPASARNYEMPSQSAAESSKILLFLMAIPNPTPAEVTAINAAAIWLNKVAIPGYAFRNTENGRALIATPGAPLLWARYYQIGTDKPLFGDRDKTIHDNVTEISLERRNGYSWYNTTPQQAVTEYAKWRTTHPK